MGVVWAVRRSLRLLTLLTLMASALCNGETLAAQEITPSRVAFAGSDSAALAGSDLGGSAAFAGSADSAAPPQPALVTVDLFEGESAVTTASASGPAATAFGPAFTFTTTLPTAPAATVPLRHHFSPPAERAPPAA